MSVLTRSLAEFKAFALQYLRNPFGAVFAIGFPLLLLGVLGAIFSGSQAQRTPEIEFLIQDLDGTTLSSQFYQTMEREAEAQTGVFNVYPTEPDYEMSVDILKEYGLTAALVIPPGFEADVEEEAPIDMVLFADPSTRSYVIISQAMQQTLDTFRRSQAGAADNITIDTHAVEIGEGFIFIDFLMPGVIAAAVMINCLMVLSSLMADYWAHGYFKILKTTPLQKWEWILTKLVWYVVVISISVVLMLLVGIYVFDSSAQVTLVSAALVLVGIVVFASIGMLIGAWAKNSDTAAGISNGIGQPMLWLSGIFFPLEDMPPFIQAIAKALPLTYLGRGLRQSMVNGNDAMAVRDLAILTGVAVLLFVVASRAISWKED